MSEEEKKEAVVEEPKAEEKEEKKEEVKAEEVKEEKKPARDASPAGNASRSDAGRQSDAGGEEKAAPSGKFKDLIKQIEEMSVADLADLVKTLEDRFGVSAAAPMAQAGVAAGAAAPEVEEKSSYTVMLKDAGAQKIAVIKAVREVNQELGLVEAKNLVDSAPKEIRKDIPKEEAEVAKKKLEAAGATVELV